MGIIREIEIEPSKFKTGDKVRIIATQETYTVLSPAYQVGTGWRYILHVTFDTNGSVVNHVAANESELELAE